jgi:hypothetical protein
MKKSSVLNYTIRRHWLFVGLVLLLLWLLPKLITAYSLLLYSVRYFVDSVGQWLRVPAETVAKIQEGVNAAGRALVNHPWITWILPVVIFSAAPVLGATMLAWNFLDLFKRDEEINIKRSIKPNVTPPAPPEASDPLTDLIDRLPK